MKHAYLLTAALLLSAGLHAQTSPTAPAQGFNVFVQNNATLTGSETEGPVAIGGDLTIGGSYQVSTNQSGSFYVNSTKVTLVVGGKVVYSGGNSLQVNQNGYVKIGDSTGSHVWYTDQNNAYSPIRITPGTNYNATPDIALQVSANNIGNVSSTNNPVFQGNLIDFATAFTTMQSTATSIASCTDNATVTDPNGTVYTSHANLSGQIKITLNSGTNVLNLTGAEMNAITNFTFNNSPDASHVLIVNVNATGTFNWTPWNNSGFGGQSNCQYILYNFYNTTSLNVQSGNAIEGTVFAPYADIVKTANSSNLEGQVIGKSYSHNGGEDHYAVFLPTTGGCGVPVHAAFTTNDTDQCLAGNSFAFTDASTGSSLTRTWSFGDGATSTTTSPTHGYTTAGTYNVKLKVTSGSSADSVTHTVVVYPAINQPGAFTTSSATVYQGQTNVTYTVPNDANATYAWSYSGTGATITGTGHSVTVTYATNATSGTLSVTPTSTHGCGTASARTIAVTVKPYETFKCGGTNSWNTASNWDGGFVPYSTISVYIPALACKPTVNSNAAVNNLTLDSANAIAIGSSVVLSAAGKVVLKGNITGGYLNLNGTTAQILDATDTIDNLELNNAAGATIVNGDTVQIKKTYKPGSGILTTNGGLELLSDSVTTAAILGKSGTCGSYIIGDVICDKYVHGGRRAWRFMGHPYSTAIPLSQLTPYIDITGNGGATNGFTPTNTNNPSAFWYNPLTGNGSSINDSTGWIPFGSTSTSGTDSNAWKPTEGIRVYFRGSKGQGICCATGYTPDSVTFKTHGPVNQCTVTATLSTNNNLGYNFISNPYASDIDLSLSTRGSAVGTNFCVWDPNQGTQGAYVEQPFSYSYILPAYSAFTTTCGATGTKTITFHETDKTSAAPTGTLFKTTDDNDFNNDPVVQLHILSNHDTTSWDRLLIFFNSQASAGTDDLDGTKFENPDLDFYTFTTDGNKMSVDQRPFVEGQVIRLGLVTDTLQPYTIRVDNYNLPHDGALYLHDKYQDTVVALAEGTTYNFTVTADAASQGDNRFELNLEHTTAVTNINSTTVKVNMYPNPATSMLNINFDAPEQDATMVVIDNMMGQQVLAQSLGDMKSGTVKVPVAQLPAGIYLVTFKCGNLTYTQRLVKK